MSDEAIQISQTSIPAGFDHSAFFIVLLQLNLPARLVNRSGNGVYIKTNLDTHFSLLKYKAIDPYNLCAFEVDVTET